MAAAGRSSAWLDLGGQRHHLGAYKHAAQAALAQDLARLLQAHLLAQAGGGDGSEPPQLSVLEASSLAELAEREDWAALRQAATLEAAVAQLAESRLAEQVGARGQAGKAGSGRHAGWECRGYEPRGAGILAATTRSPVPLPSHPLAALLRPVLCADQRGRWRGGRG